MAKKILRKTNPLKKSVHNEAVKSEPAELVATNEIKRFASFPKLNPNPVLELDSSGKITFCNNAAYQILEELNLKDANVFLPEDITDILNALEQKNDVKLYREVRIKDRILGENISFVPQFNSLRIYATDITDRKSYQEALQNALEESRRREAEISALLEASSAVLKYSDFNSAAKAIFDSCKNLIGATSGYIALLSKDRTENEVLFLDSGGLPCTVDPNLPMPIRGLRAEAYHNVKTVYHNNFHRSEWMQFMPEGHVKLNNVMFAPMVIEGKTVGLLGIANKPRGFTENDVRLASAFAELAAIVLTQKRAEEALKNSEQRYRSLVELSPDAIAVHSEGKYVYVNPSGVKLFGVTKANEIVGKKVLDLVHPDYRKIVSERIQLSYEQKIQPPIIELKIVRLNGQLVDVEAMLTPITFKGKPATQLVFRDITKRKKAEEALEKSNQRLEILSETASQLLKSDRPQQIVEDLCRKVMDYLDCHVFLNFLVDEEKQRLHLNAYSGISEETAKDIEWLDSAVVVCGIAACDGCPIVYENIPETKDPHIDHINSFGIKAYACYPLFSQNRVIGTLSFGTRSRNSFTKNEIELMKSVADQVSIAMERIRFLENLENQVRERTADLRRAYTEIEAFFESSITPLVFLDRDFNFIRVNEAYAKCCARDISEFKGHNHFEFYPNEENKAIFRKVVETKTPYQAFAKAFSFPDHPEWGVTYWNWTLTPILDSSGEVDFLVFALNDVTKRKQAEMAIKESEKKYRELIEQAADGIAILNKHLNIVDVNSAACQIGGYNREELIGLNASQLILEEDLIKRPLSLDNILAGETIHTERRMKKRDGTIIDVDVSAKLLEDGTIQVIARDITERKETEKQTGITSKLLELFITKPSRKEYMSSVVKEIAKWSGCRCVGIRVVDNNGYIPYEATTGFSEEFLRLENMLSLKKDMCPCIRAITGKLEPQDVSALTPYGSFRIDNSLKFVNGLTEHEKSRFRGICIRNGFLSIAIIPIRYMGKTIGAIHLTDEKEVMVHLKLVKFIESVVTHLIGEAIQRFKIEEALRKSKESLSKAQQIAHIGNWIWNVQEDGLFWSDEIYRIFGVTPGLELNFKTFLNYIHPEDRELVEKDVSEALYGRPYDIEHRIVLPDGTVRVVHEQGEVTFGESDEPVQMLVTVQDITDRKKAEIELMSSREQLRNLSEHLQSVREEERTNIAREIHDELGQALTALKMDISMISNKLYPDHKPLVEKTGSIMKRIDETIQSVKKICTELRPTVLDHFGLPAAIEWQAEDFQKTTGIKCEVSLHPEDIVLDQDTSIVLFRIFQEALTNIMRHSDATEVKTTLQEKDGIITLRVKDNGKGITEEEITNSSSFGLLGMRERVNFLGGNVTISGVRNKGTTIRVNIPSKKIGKGHDENTHR